MVPKKRRAVSLSFELAEVLDAVAGVQLLAHRLQEPGASDDPEHPQAVASTLAGLSMVAARLKFVVAAIRNQVDPSTLLAPHNAVPAEHDQPDVLLRRWSPEQVDEHAREAARLAGRRAERKRRWRR